jgi:peptide/nickel transport system ATP-binding protein
MRYSTPGLERDNLDPVSWCPQGNGGISVTLLNVEDLTMHFATREGAVRAVEGVSFSVEKRRVLGLAGESGSGKSSIALTLMRLLPSNGKIIHGNILLDDQDVLTRSEPEFRRDVRWKKISLISQAAMNSLNPVFRVGDQIKEAITVHSTLPEAQAETQVRRLLREVGISEDRYSAFPHELSGGMKQRAIIAMALALAPPLVIADEPTTALDVIVQAQILLLLKKLQREMDMAMILITHDLSLVAEMCDDVAIIYGGQIVEYGPASAIFHNPKHPYTIGLIRAVPSVEGGKRRLISIIGEPPDLIRVPTACRFAPRCQYATEKCRTEEPPLDVVEQGHSSRCWYAGDMHL